MNVEYHERGVFWVQGSEDLPYRVDLTCYDGIGRCDCMDFRTRKQPRLEAGERLVELRCRHIEHVRSLLSNPHEQVLKWMNEEKEP